VVAEKRATLVNRNRMAADLYIEIVGDLRWLEWIRDPASRIDRIPHPRKPWLAISPRHHPLEILRQTEAVVYLPRAADGLQPPGKAQRTSP
jgi:hypothetical protein